MNVREELFNKQDANYRKFHCKLIPNINEEMIIGVRLPELRKLAKVISQAPFEFQCSYYEEIMLTGFVIGYSKGSINDKTAQLERFIPLIDNWAVCDSVCSTLKFTNKYKDEIWSFLMPYAKSDKEYFLRFSIVMMMDYYLDDEYIDRVIEILSSVKSEYYYVNMAISWALATAYVKYPERVGRLIEKSLLPPWVHNKTIQKICESNRINDKDKQKLKKLKLR